MCRSVGGSITPITEWLQCADHALAPLCRSSTGSYVPVGDTSLTIIGKSLNHKTHQATAIYARLDLDPVRQSVNTATAAMLEAAGLKEGATVLPLPKKSRGGA